MYLSTTSSPGNTAEATQSTTAFNGQKQLYIQYYSQPQKLCWRTRTQSSPIPGKAVLDVSWHVTRPMSSSPRPEGRSHLIPPATTSSGEGCKPHMQEPLPPVSNRIGLGELQWQGNPVALREFRDSGVIPVLLLLKVLTFPAASSVHQCWQSSPQL